MKRFPVRHRTAGAEKILQVQAGQAEAERVALALGQRGDAGDRQPRELDFVHCLWPRGEIHGGAGIQHEKNAELRFLLVLPDVQALRAAEQPPVHAARVVAKLIVAVFGKLDRRTFLRAAMTAVEKTVHEITRLEFERRQFRQQLHVQRRQPFGKRRRHHRGLTRLGARCAADDRRHGHYGRRRAHDLAPGYFTISSSRSMMVSTVWLSASAR